MSTRKRDAFGTGETTEAKADAERDATDVRIRELEAELDMVRFQWNRELARAEKAEKAYRELKDHHDDVCPAGTVREREAD